MDPSELLDAHVRFELDRWRGDALTASLSAEIGSMLEWLATVPVRDLVDPEAVVDLARRSALALLADPASRRASLRVMASAAQSALPEGTSPADLVDRADYDRLVEVAIGMDALRDEVVAQVTTSEAYSNLLAHVLYTGLKSYVLTENVLARKVPGASSLVRLGQSAVRTAAPRLEKGIDRQLTAFVNANISDSIKESRRYLDQALDDTLMTAVADDLWRANAQRPLTEAAALVHTDQVDAMVDVLADIARDVIESDEGRDVLAAAVAAWFGSEGGRMAADVLADAGITSDAVPDLVAAISPAVETAERTGYLEARIRARLEPFYATL